MWTPATPGQTQKLSELLGQVKATSEQMQSLLGNGDLLKMMLSAPKLSWVDRHDFAALVDPPPINWSPVSTIARKIASRSQERGWGLTTIQIDLLEEKLATNKHAGSMLPTGISLSLGRGLQYDWHEAVLWLKDEINAFGPVSFTEWFSADHLLYSPGSEPATTGVSLDVALLDFQTFRDPKNGVSPRGFWNRRSRWPSTEVLWLLALNPHVYMGMDGKAYPYLWAVGAYVSYSGYFAGLPLISRHPNGISRHSGYEGYRDSSVVAFREY